MTRYKRTSGRRSSTPRAHSTRIYAHTSPASRNRRHLRRVHLQEKNDDMRRDQKDGLEDTYRSLLCGENGAGYDESRSSDGSDMDDSSNESEWDDETTLVEMLGSPYLSSPRSPTLLISLTLWKAENTTKGRS